MHTQLILTLLGSDRTGLVESLAEAIAERQGNWIESRMCRLGGQFAGVLRADIPAGQEVELLKDIERLRSSGLSVQYTFEPHRGETAPSLYYQLEVLGRDRPGIVASLFKELAGKSINVEELTTGCKTAPWSGEVLFESAARLSVPASTDMAALTASLDKLADDLMIEIKLERVQHL
ncbi:MAG: ACT domain-containing protein [Verrucomicrobiota bacterium]|nr:ACT domain-containing protein [Verrucomicrobiota bacterium]